MAFGPDSTVGTVVQRVAGSKVFSKVAPKIVPPIDRLLHKLSGGRFMMSRMMLPCLVLTTTGRRSGQPRESPLATVPYDRDLYVVGSNFGKPNHPAWSSNLLAEPSATVSFDNEEYPVRAELLSESQKADTWPKLIAEWPLFDQYVERSGRDLRVFRLRRI